QPIFHKPFTYQVLRPLGREKPGKLNEVSRSGASGEVTARSKCRVHAARFRRSSWVGCLFGGCLPCSRDGGRVGPGGRERGHNQRQESGDRRKAREERKANVSSGAGARSCGRSERRLE